MAEIKEEKTEKKKKKKGFLLVILLILLLLIVIGVCLGVIYKITTTESKSRLARDELALGGLLPGKTPEEISEILNAKIQEGMVDIGIAVEPVFEQNGRKGRIGIENIEANRYSFQVDILLDETGDRVYQSGIVDPGYYIEYIALDKILQAGDYPATAVFTTYSLDESEDKIAEARVRLILHVTDGTYYK